MHKYISSHCVLSSCHRGQPTKPHARRSRLSPGKHLARCLTVNNAKQSPIGPDLPPTIPHLQSPLERCGADLHPFSPLGGCTKTQNTCTSYSSQEKIVTDCFCICVRAWGGGGVCGRVDPFHFIGSCSKMSTAATGQEQSNAPNHAVRPGDSARRWKARAEKGKKRLKNSKLHTHTHTYKRARVASRKVKEQKVPSYGLSINQPFPETRMVVDAPPHEGRIIYSLSPGMLPCHTCVCVRASVCVPTIPRSHPALLAETTQVSQVKLA